jgi:TRAP-type mannitol/chloroaromatic compound transport system substrate-binding protein
MSLPEFKQRLYEAHKSQELVLARADLVAAMDRDKVDASEMNTPYATFHFVERR